MVKPHNAIAAVVVLLVTAACSSGTGESASPSFSPVASLAPASPSPSPSGSPASPDATVSTPDEAAQRVIEKHPEFAGMTPLDPDLIGACCWYEATAVPGGFQVVFVVGWGDCPSGCIEEHRWTFAVSPKGEVGLIGEAGPSVPPDVMPA